MEILIAITIVEKGEEVREKERGSRRGSQRAEVLIRERNLAAADMRGLPAVVLLLVIALGQAGE